MKTPSILTQIGMFKELLEGDRGVVGIYLTPILPKTEQPLHAPTLLIAFAGCNRAVRCEHILYKGAGM